MFKNRLVEPTGERLNLALRVAIAGILPTLPPLMNGGTGKTFCWKLLIIHIPMALGRRLLQPAIAPHKVGKCLSCAYSHSVVSNSRYGQ
ncbi:hypothetical protein [Halomicronema sp. CCY15110]|uniref:hypothetical protein n=1 Tax=Halomicronema sp. CCY15110 TaxID=2767773 RepID=UPI00194DC6E9|nr:hypothetical protein [Halomicronema sp. CCY15110]